MILESVLWQCLSKVPYRTKREARQARAPNSPQKPYFCVSCEHWHLGNDQKDPNRTPISRKVKQQRKLRQLQRRRQIRFQTYEETP